MTICSLERSFEITQLHLHSFQPIESPGARVLILGTMPSKASLRARQYYAHPMNAFWKILGEILRIPPDGPYERRTAALAASGIALWDVLKTCTRETSLDSDIEEGSAVPNDFAAFFAGHGAIRKICFNGAKAEQLYRRHVMPAVEHASRLAYVRLPSTSPANASIPFRRKLRAWRAIRSAA